MNEVLERTPHVIAIEINSIKEQTKRMLLYNSIEIGRRLVEAKALVEYGEWGKWLQESVDYSQSTANNLMRIFEEYGSDQIAFFDNNAKSQSLGNLGYTQAVALLSLPEEEREAFVEEHDIDNISTRELQQLIKEKQDLQEKLKKAEEEAETEKLAKDILTESYGELYNRHEKQTEEAAKLRKELEAANESGIDEEEVERLREELQEAESKVEKLTEQLNAPQVIEASVVEKIPEEIEQELNQLREKTKELESKASQQSDKAILKFNVHFETLVKGFGDLLTTLSEIEDIETKEKYKNAVSVMISKMSERV